MNVTHQGHSGGRHAVLSAGKRMVRRRLLAGAGIAIAGVAAVAPAVTAGPASASTDYGISMVQACRYTYNNPTAYALFVQASNPFSWYCVEPSSVMIGLPPSVTVVNLGGVDVQKYCSITYPGSRAVIVAWNAYGWRCQT